MLFAAEESMISVSAALGVASPIVLAVVGGLILLYKALMTSKDEMVADKKLVIAGLEKEKALLQEKADAILATKEAERKEEEGLKKIYMEVGAEAIRSALESRNEKRRSEGKSPLVLPIAIVPEGQSPPTLKQLEAAQAGTMRAALVTIKADAGQVPRKEPGHADDYNFSEGANSEGPTSAVPINDPVQANVAGAVAAVSETAAATGIADDAAKVAAGLATQLAVATAKVVSKPSPDKKV